MTYPAWPRSSNVKNKHRLDYSRIAEILAERGLVDAHAVNETLNSSTLGGQPFPEALVNANLVGDWELAAVVCEVHNLPFVTVDIAKPDMDAFEGLDSAFLKRNCLVPMARHGKLLTICMPAISPAGVLKKLSGDSGLQILPVVGTVRTNRKWLAENLTDVPDAALPDLTTATTDADWSSIFDQGDANVLFELQDQPEAQEETAGDAVTPPPAPPTGL